MSRRIPARAGLAGVVLSLLASPLAAQLTEATLKGVVTDAGGKVITGSPVEAKSEATGQTPQRGDG